MRSSPLSSADLPAFFAPHHFELGAQLAEMAPSIADGTRGEPVEIVPCLGKHGLLRHLVPDDDSRADVRALCLVREMLGYASPAADAVYAVQGLACSPVFSTAPNSPVLGEFRSGTAVGAFALTEPEAGSDVASLRTTATRDGDGFLLSGTKTLISNADIASHFVVFANADPDAGRRGITAFLVPRDAPGLAVEPFAVGVDHPIGDVVFDRCRVPKNAVLGHVGQGFELAMQTLDRFRVTVGAAAVGMARRAICEALDHVRNRHQFGKALADQPVVRSLVADMVTDFDAARLLVLRAAQSADTGAEDAALQAAKAKLFATEAAFRIIDCAVQLFGGRGVRRGEVVEHLYRAIRPLRIYEGTSEIQRLIIGRAAVRSKGLA